MTGDEWSQIFADSISGVSFERPIGIADVAWNGCCWSVKTVKNNNPHKAKTIRLISGRNSPSYSSGINDPFANVQATGQSVLDIYNNRIEKAKSDHKDTRLVALARNMETQEFTIFECPITPIVVNNYQWKVNNRQNLEGYDGARHVFTWQPHGSQFTIIEPIPEGATCFRITRKPKNVLEVKRVLKWVQFGSDWVEILRLNRPEFPEK